MKENRDRSVRIIPKMIDKAIENLIYRRDTHIDILIDKLEEPRVRKDIEPMLANSDKADDGLIPTDDIQYVEDMGLIKRERVKPRRIANGIYCSSTRMPTHGSGASITQKQDRNSCCKFSCRG